MHQGKYVDVRGIMALMASCKMALFFADDLESRIGQLQEEMLDLTDRSEAILHTAEEQNRDLTEEESAEIDQINALSEKKLIRMKQHQAILMQKQTLAQGTGRQTTPQGPAPGDPSPVRNANGGAILPLRTSRGIESVRGEPGKWGFKDFGDFMKAVHYSSRQGGPIDQRFLAAGPTTLQQEGVGGDGGYAVPPDFRSTIMSKLMAEGSLLGRTDQYPTSSNILVLPLDETTQWQASGGVKAYWEGENMAPTDTKGTLTPFQTRLFKVMAIVRASDEILEDAAGMNGWINKKVPAAIDFAVNMAIVQGIGAGMPLGILKSPALITIAKETSQPTATLVAANIEKMWARCYAESRGNAVWLANQTIEPQLFNLAHAFKNVAGTENVGGWPMYVPAGGLSASPYSTLMGRPIVYTQACETLGSLGDLILADLSQYLTAVKSPGGVRSDVSIHVYFDYDVTSFRFILRLGGQPEWTKVMTDRAGTTTYSPFVALAARP